MSSSAASSMRDAAGVSAASRWPMSVAQMLKASRGVMSTHQRPRSGSVDAEAAQSSTNGAREAGASAKICLEAHEHGVATVVTENDRLGAMKFGPATQIGQLVVAEHGERAAERFGSLHGLARHTVRAQRLRVVCNCCRFAPQVKSRSLALNARGMFNGASNSGASLASATSSAARSAFARYRCASCLRCFLEHLERGSAFRFV